MKTKNSIFKNLFFSTNGVSSLFALLALGGVSIGFGLGFFIAHQTKGIKQEEVVAVYNGTGVTAQDAYFSIKNRLYEIESTLFDMKKQAILDHIQAKLLENEAKKENTTIPALLVKNTSNSIDPSEKDINDYMVSKNFTTRDRKTKKEDVRNYLKYRASIEKRQTYMEKLTANAKIKLLISEPSEKSVSLSLDGYATWGNKNAPVTVVEYSDFPCANCARNTETIEKLKKEYGPDKVRIVFAENPTPSNPRAYPSAIAARCANEQGKFWEMRDLLFSNSNKLEDNNFKDYAKNLGLDIPKFETCLQKKQYSEQIEKSKQQALKHGILAIPTIIVNGSLLQGYQPFEKVKQKVEASLK